MARVNVVLIGVVLISVMAGCASKDTPPYDAEIRDWFDLHTIRCHLDKSFILMNDLDATTAGYEELASEGADHGKGWQPIGASDHRFTGSFNGQGYEIRDVVINRPDGTFVGLFGAVGGQGVIQNVGVVNASVTGEWTVGGLVGGNWGHVSDSYLTGSVSGDDCVGGLVGGNAGSVSSSYAIAIVTGHWDVGGLVGGNDLYGNVSTSYSVGEVTGEWAVGGLLGGNWGGAVNSSYSTSNVSGADYVGGLVGDNQGAVSNSCSTGNVTGDWYIGGLVGYNGEGIVSNCYSIGGVNGDWHAGGLVGGNVEGTVINSFWDVEASGIEESEGGTGKTTIDMQDIDTFANTTPGELDHPWDIAAVASGETDDTHIWNIVNEQTYPFLSRASVQN